MFATIAVKISSIRKLKTQFGARPCIYVSCLDCKDHCKISFRFLLMKNQDAVAFFGEDIHEHAECVLTMEERGTHSSSEFSTAHFAKLSKSLRKSGATAKVCHQQRGWTSMMQVSTHAQSNCTPDHTYSHRLASECSHWGSRRNMNLPCCETQRFVIPIRPFANLDLARLQCH